MAQDSWNLALATKQDSTAIKFLAAVTVVFIPGKFDAALFQWDTQTVGHSVVSGHFWVYWAVGIPLTFVTPTLWFAGMRLRTRRHRVRELESVEELSREIDGPQRECKKKARDMPDKENGLKRNETAKDVRSDNAPGLYNCTLQNVTTRYQTKHARVCLLMHQRCRAVRSQFNPGGGGMFPARATRTLQLASSPKVHPALSFRDR